jgi:hypothetical protein
MRGIGGEMKRICLLVGAALVLGGACGAPSGPPIANPTGATATATPLTPRYEVHEWGLVRGTADDRVMLSGPHAPEPVLAVTKPVLYFHRTGEGSLRVDVEARIPNGRIVEHWPTAGGDPGNVAAWHGVLIESDACRGSRYPTLSEAPCRGLVDGCESATLASIETTDSSCVYWPRPPDDDGPTEAWNHLFYRGEIPSARAPTLPLRAELAADGTLRLTTTGTRAIPGSVLRIRHVYGAPGMTDAIAVATPPAPGASIVVPVPVAPLSSGPAALDATLREAGLTSHEAAAFARAWNAELFGASQGAQVATETRATTTTPVMPTRPRPSTSLLYILPSDAADGLAALSFSPPPTAVRRAIAVWIDETATR